MDQKQKILTALFIVLNLVIWGFFIIPRFGGFTKKLFTARIASADDTTQIFEQTESSRELLERINFSGLRDPFEKPTADVVYSYTPKTTTTTSTTVASVTVTTLAAVAVVEKSFTSQFELDNIMEFDGAYIATLKETDHYGSSGTPYSYRFGSESSSAESYMVLEGETVMTETVAKINADSVIMESDGLYYKLTFSGGYSVSGID